MSDRKGFLLQGTKNEGVLLCHTLAGEPEQMRELGSRLQKEGYYVLCPLYKGHDGSFHDVIMTEVTDWYDTVLKAYEELSTLVDRIYVVGMSIGGTFATKLAMEKPLHGLITINAPIIGFDVVSDVMQFQQDGKNANYVERYKEHRMNYFHFVTELGQIKNIKTITCPIFTLQGELDKNRYKTSTMMLQTYATSEVKQRKDYANSHHLILLETDKEQAIVDIVQFIQQN